jgi:monoamine oxidase
VLDGDALFEQPTGEAVRLAGNPIDRPAWRVDGGMQALATEIARRLPAGTVQIGVAVRSAAFEADGSVLVTTDTTTVAASAILLAVPPALAVASIAFTPALPPGLIQAAQAVHTWMSDTVKVTARFDEAFWREAGLAGAALSHVGPFCEFHDHSGPNAGQAALFGFAPAARLGGVSRDAIAAHFTEHVARLWGPSPRHPVEIHIADWSRDPFTSAAGAPTPSSYWYYGTPVLRLPHIDGRLVFGSTETASAFPGYLEGAVLAGRRAAGQALDRVTRS